MNPGPSPFDHALEVMAGTPAVLGAVVHCLTSEAVDFQPRDDAWSPRQVLGHLLFAERAIIGPRLRAVAEEDGVPVLPSPQAPPPGDPVRMLEEWTTARAINLHWLNTLTSEQRAHASVHPRHGRVTLEEHVVEWAYHDVDHMRQILGALAADLYPHMGAWQSLYAPPS